MDERRTAWATERAEPVGEPVVRADPSVTGDHAPRAVEFDPDDPESAAAAAETVAAFAAGDLGTENIYLLRGAAACAALTRAEGSYTAAAARAGGDTTVGFIRKWARVHDLPQSVRRHVARGSLAPTAAKHIARVRGEARLALAWAAIDGDLTVREVRRTASAVADGDDVETALADVGVDLGSLCLDLPAPEYLELRRVASMRDVPPGEIVAEALDRRFTER
ncbi:MAG: hypothetical protein V5A31_00030 [Haloferacaceae archaeon]